MLWGWERGLLSFEGWLLLKLDLDWGKGRFDEDVIYDCYFLNDPRMQ